MWAVAAPNDRTAAAPAPPKQRTRTQIEVRDLGTRRQGVDWPGFLGPFGNSKSPERGILRLWPVRGPKLVWQRRLGTGYGMPSISRGRLFLFERVGNQAQLACLHSETGRPLWKFRYPTAYEDSYGYNNGPRCCPVIDGDRVYIYGAEGMLHCVRVADGKMVWKVDTARRFGVVQNFFGVGSTPVIEGDLLIAQVGGSPAESQHLTPSRLDEVRSNGSAVVAFDKWTGAVRHKIGDELASYASPVLATIGGRRWCFVFARGGLFAFEPLTGKIDFHYPWRARLLESVNASNPVVVGDEVFISETYGPGSSLLKVRPGGQEVVWRDTQQRRKAMQTHWNTPIYHDGYLYGSSGRHTGNADLRCIEWKTGKVMWSQPRLTRSSLLYVDGHFVCLGEYGTLRLLRVNPHRFDEVATTVLDDPDPGEPLRRLRYPAWAAPILSHGLLYVRGRDQLVCLELIPERD
jgi:outer membrane protein assembly factor BamB